MFESKYELGKTTYEIQRCYNDICWNSFLFINTIWSNCNENSLSFYNSTNCTNFCLFYTLALNPTIQYLKYYFLFNPSNAKDIT